MFSNLNRKETVSQSVEVSDTKEHMNDRLMLLIEDTSFLKGLTLEEFLAIPRNRIADLSVAPNKLGGLLLIHDKGNHMCNSGRLQRSRSGTDFQIATTNEEKTIIETGRSVKRVVMTIEFSDN